MKNLHIRNHQEVCFYVYKELIISVNTSSLQAKETTQIEDDVLENIKKQIKRENHIITIDK